MLFEHTQMPHAQEPSQRDTQPSWLQTVVLLRCRLCWRVTVAVFLSILAVEAVILVPSYRNFERDRILEFRRAAAAAIDAAVALHRDDTGLPADRMVGVAGIRGLTLIDPKRRIVAGAGDEPDAISMAQLDSRDVDYIQVGRERMLVRLRIDMRGVALAYANIATPELSGMLRAFVLRIIGLVALIAVVVTIATMLVLRYTVLSRIVGLAHNLSAAALAPHNADRFLTGEKGADELGALMSDANHLLLSAAGALRELRRREVEVVELNGTLERRVAERTVELEAARVAAEAASNAKSLFLANMSHELRTPLNAIIGFSEVMSNEVLGPIGNASYRAYTVDILHSGRHLLQVIEDVLDLSRIETGQLELAEGEVDLVEVLFEALELIAPQAASRGVVVVRELPPARRMVWGDARRLRQVALSLLSNAVSFTPQGRRITASIVCRMDGTAAIRIVDQGIGIARDQLDLVMRPFGQVAEVTARGHQGLGLGLPLANRFLQLHGGHLELQSEPGRGTTVWAWLPAERARAPEAQCERAVG